uniref:ladinin-1-like isoform X1 n=1 Tax=Doryrhamphus excisus TaxID=161450 RepID=UPI0025AE9E07|nr:ladinin-1-like isoform X1 [Doryrhamphus excisus]XP_057939731.1 ladinin-1-like isoform X1 [Doryrhamphus excisus]
MSNNRTNWSALSSLARQWTMEDEEEAERERRRRVKSSSSTCDLELNATAAAPIDYATTTSNVVDSAPETSQSAGSIENMQMDFMEMLRIRDEKRRMRHVETLRRQKGVREDDADESEKATLYIPKDVRSNRAENTDIEPCPDSSPSGPQQENGEPPENESVSRHHSTPPRKFISSVSISIDNSPYSPNRTQSLTNPRPNGEHSPCRSPISNGHAEVFEENVNSSSTNNNPEQTPKPVFIRKSSRTLSFRMMKKKEEENFPLQRSSSVRMASKKFETTTDQAANEQKSSFQRNSVQRISSRSIQEKMERLAEAAQKSETPRSPDVSQRTLYLLDEVSRKRGLFENEQQTVKQTSSSQHEFRGSSSGVSDRINRWLDKTNQSGCSSSSSTDLKHVDITSKRSLFENRSHDSPAKSKPPGKI